jgi:hypothetical protein
MRIVGRLVQKQVLHEDAFHRGEPGRDVLRIGVGLQDVLALDVEAAERAVERGVKHIRDAQTRIGVEAHAPIALEEGAHVVVRNMAVTRQPVREGAHVAQALDVV